MVDRVTVAASGGAGPVKKIVSVTLWLLPTELGFNCSPFIFGTGTTVTWTTLLTPL